MCERGQPGSPAPWRMRCALKIKDGCGPGGVGAVPRWGQPAGRACGFGRVLVGWEFGVWFVLVGA